MQCAEVDSNGMVVAVPVPTSGLDACAFVLETPQEVAMNSAPWALTTEQAGQIGGATLLLWALAWGVRQIGNVIRHTDKEES